MKKLKKNNILRFLDEHIILILSGILLIVIPLYPKLPLFDIIPGYIVRVRAEDFLILFTIIVLLIQIFRKKASLKTPITKFVFAYSIIGFLSVLSGIFITKTIPTTSVHLSKSILHFLRYIEYFSLFFIFYNSVKSKKDLKILASTSVITFILVGIYGFGQKYLYWPVYSTMNREFSKGIRLYLTEHARVQSTFGGHYDMAAYIVIILPMIFALSQYTKNKIAKLFLWSSFILGIWLMIMSVSRASIAAVVIGLITTILLLSLTKDKLAEKIKSFVANSLKTGLIFLIMILIFGKSLSERLIQGLNSYPIVEDNLNLLVKNIESNKEYIVSRFEEISLFNQVDLKKPENGISTDQAAVLVASDTRPSPIKPSDVFVDVPDQIRVATVSATGVESTIIIEVPRTYSENAIKHGLSFAIRLDTLWPQALNGFYANPLLGTGYATLTKSEVNQFTEADSTDNNFLRTLGENGLLGFITFYGIVIISLIQAIKIIFYNNEKNKLKIMVALGFFGSAIGMLVNAIGIDVFAASKVALTFWSLTGILFSLNNIKTIK